MSAKKSSSELEDLDLKKVYLKVNDLSYKNEALVEDLIRFLQEKLLNTQIVRDKNEIEISIPPSMSKRIIRLRIRKFLYKNNLKNDFRPISYRENEKDGYEIHEKKKVQLEYY